ncbi:unnamed protein product [Allacma fusca]|uniref:N-acetyltransferase domain-containing protein n=1 Tax=Allacma fusca TaxID=39272 RepID=A0A8J2K8E2_9HEXA|nr:unnamed protein product [Allacma fusca]
MRTCLLDEPMTKLLVPDEEYFQDFDKLVTLTLEQNLTFVAIERSTGRFAGARISFNHKRDTDWSVFDFKSSKMAKLMQYINCLDDHTRLFEKYNLDSYITFFLAIVHPDFRKQGLVTEMYRRAVDLARAEGFFLAKACFSSPYSRAAALKVGFQEVARITYSDVKDENGKPVIPGAMDDQHTWVNGHWVELVEGPRSCKLEKWAVSKMKILNIQFGRSSMLECGTGRISTFIIIIYAEHIDMVRFWEITKKK